MRGVDDPQTLDEMRDRRAAAARAGHGDAERGESPSGPPPAVADISPSPDGREPTDFGNSAA